MPLRVLAPALIVLAIAAPASAASATPDARNAPSRAKASASMRDSSAAQQALSRVERLAAGRGVRTGRELTHALRDLAVRLPALRGAERREASAYLARPTDGAGDPFGDGYAAPATAHCSQSFCVHYVTTTADAPPPGDSDADTVPDFVELVAAELENVRGVENGTLGWPAPVSDGGRGGDARTDVYLKDIGEQGLFGYAATDPGQAGNSRYAFLVLDNDYAQSEFPNYPNPAEPLQVTAAHEYLHLIHYGIDALQDFWLFESSAVWMEDQVYDSIDDYLNYLPAPRWVAQTEIPLTRFNPANPLDPANIKVYGDAVWNHWLANRHGSDIVRATWGASLSSTPPSFAPGAYDAALRGRGSSFFDEFVYFSAALPEWHLPAAGFPEGASYPAVERVATLAPDAALAMDHTTFALLDVPVGAPQVTLAAGFPAGTAAGIALVGRDGAGGIHSAVLGLRDGGRGQVTLPGAAGLERITAVLINADVSQIGYDGRGGDWRWSRDAQCATATVAPDGAAPALRLESAAAGARPDAPISAVFTESVYCLGPDAVQLVDPQGRVLVTSVAYDPVARRLVIDPAADLRESTRYRVRVAPRVTDASGNPAAAEIAFETVRRPPVFTLSAPRAQRSSAALRRGVEVTLRSRDSDPLSFAVALDAPRRALPARTVGERRGRVGPRGTARLRIRLRAPAQRALAAGRTLRVKVVARVRDPQGNSVRRTRTVVLRPSSR